MTLTAIIPGSPRARISLLARAAIALFFVAIPACVFAQGAPQIVGSIEGEDFAVDSANGGTTQAIQAVNGQLASGARVTVKSGQARVIFNSGGAIAICGAARFQLLASGGTLTVVLEYGEIDLHLDADSAVKIFTPLIVATPISIGGGTRETIVGLARSGDMCLHTPHGAARVEQQLSGESLLVPQFGEVSLAGGQVMALKSPNGTCACQVDEARLIKPKAPAVQAAPTMVTKETIGALATPETKRPGCARYSETCRGARGTSAAAARNQRAERTASCAAGSSTCSRAAAAKRPAGAASGGPCGEHTGAAAIAGNRRPDLQSACACADIRRAFAGTAAGSKS